MCSVLALAINMSLFWDLHQITGPGRVFHGFTSTRMIVLLQHLRQHDHMRFAADGRPESRSLSRRFERTFRENFALTPEQYECIVDVFDRAPIDDIPSAIGASIPRPVPGERPHYMLRTFKSDKTRCCGRALRVTYVWATVFLKDDRYPVWNVVKKCRSGCGARYMFDRRIIRGVYDGGQCLWHMYAAWSGGTPPLFIANKSGQCIFSTKYLDHVAIEQSTTK